VPGCHRSQQAIADLGGGIHGMNFACSGATTTSHVSGSEFKPGLDFFHDGKGREGQAYSLAQFASTHDVSAVVISIGGNDFNFSSLVATCSVDFLTTTGTKTPKDCNSDPGVEANFKPANVDTVTTNIEGALQRVAGAMQQAGYSRDDYTTMVLTYPAPIPSAAEFRYPPTGKARGDLGGCPFSNADADWAGPTALATINKAMTDAVTELNFANTGVLDMTDAFTGHRLCEKGVGQRQETSLSSWKDSGASDQLEWVNEIYIKGAPWQQQESFHPDYWGMLAERNCVRQALTASPVTFGSCAPGSDGSQGDEPGMTLTP
jgi:hypothetical protein